MTILVVGVVAAVVALGATPLCMAVARRTGLVDRPGPLKPQGRSVPYLGGVAVFVAAVIGGAVGRPLLLLPLGLVLVLGVVDDARHLPPWTRLVGQLGIGAVVAWVVPTHLPGALGPVLVIAVAVLLINGVNMIDGLDTLAGGVVAVAGLGFGWLLRGDARDLAVALACALAGFLVYNRPPARIYLGDGGSYLLGTALTILLASAWAPGRRAAIGVAGLIVVAVPAAEVLFSVVRRLRSRRSLVLGDRGHPYDRLMTRGWPVVGASGAYIGAEGVLVVGAVATAASAGVVPAVVMAVATAAALVGAGAVAGSLTPDSGVGT
ncbi:MAG TPA: MraY family glycosyltransferase [Acidimicrobiales bacterium]|nr:MraY family glycosyltransferase [Acidimicrobiales bacterium]